jgi:hypothetical protein
MGRVDKRKTALYCWWKSRSRGCWLMIEPMPMSTLDRRSPYELPPVLAACAVFSDDTEEV